jgi:hypothetical protein
VRRLLIIGVALVAAWFVPAAAGASGPSVSLSDPANGALFTGGQPMFSGGVTFDSGSPGQVTINIYTGTSASGVPIQALNGSSSSGAFTTTSATLIDGTYTAQAVATDPGGSASSQPVTFQVFNGQPQLTLTAPAAPIQTAAPTFTGTALTDPGDAQTVYLIVYPGSSTDRTPVAVLPGAVNADGSFSIPVVPGLAPGAYTAVASQQLALSSTFSPTVAFTITSTAASLTVSSPAPGASEPQTGVDFSGSAGAAYGDSSTIDLTLYRGSMASGTPVGKASVTRDGTSWSERWPDALALGTYTLQVTQENVVNSATRITHTFTVAPPGSVTGTITISAKGKLSARLACLDGAGTCAGDVLIVTKASLQPLYGGPRGPLSLMFQRFSVAAAQSKLLTAQLSSTQLKALRRAGASRLEVTVAYSVGSKLTEVSRETAGVTVG